MKNYTIRVSPDGTYSDADPANLPGLQSDGTAIFEVSHCPDETSTADAAYLVRASLMRGSVSAVRYNIDWRDAVARNSSCCGCCSED